MQVQHRSCSILGKRPFAASASGPAGRAESKFFTGKELLSGAREKFRNVVFSDQSVAFPPSFSAKSSQTSGIWLPRARAPVCSRLASAPGARCLA
jgi:hypothetical protein